MQQNMILPEYDIDFYGDEFINNPFPHYAKMRELGAVVWVPRLGNYALPRYNEVQTALRDHETFISSLGVAGDQFGCDFLQGNTVASDEPRHSELRMAMAPPLLPGALSKVSDKIEETADELVQSLLKRDEFDAVSELARYLPLTVVRDLVGLPNFAQDNMLKWAGAAFDVLGMQNERGKAALSSIKEMREFIEKDATPENLKEGSWTWRINELVKQGNLPCEHAAYAIRDYINPSLDTTISATGELVFQLGKSLDQWQLIRQSPELINNAVNEAVRLGTSIRSFSRHARKDVDIEGYTIREGARVMMLFASANRDERQFQNPEKFDPTRPPNQHLGFGSGIHMCVGMHLAQLEMAALLRAMLRHVDTIEVGEPEVAMNNSIRAYSSLPCKFTKLEKQNSLRSRQASNKEPQELIAARIEERTMVAKDIVSLKLISITNEPLPPAKAGAHIDVHIAPGLVRQYSLTGKMENGTYLIATQKELNSKGGSSAIHSRLEAGSKIEIGHPRNNFPLDDTQAPALLVAGGIGLTPLLGMAWELYETGRDFRLLIFARSRSRIAFADKFQNLPFEDKIMISCDDEIANNNNLHIGSIINKLGENTQFYTCGPNGFMQHVCKIASEEGLPESQIHLEHFGAEIDTDGDPFTLIAQRSDLTIEVPANKSILEALNEHGIKVETSCENGVCGSCLTPVLDGTPDHRDMVQTDMEKASNKKIAVCCSRSKSKNLILDV